MKIDKNLNNKELTITLEGRLDTDTAPDLDKELNSLEGIEKITFDFNKLEYISSAGLRSLLYCQKRLNKEGAVTIKGANEDIKNILSITGFDNILKIN